MSNETSKEKLRKQLAKDTAIFLLTVEDASITVLPEGTRAERNAIPAKSKADKLEFLKAAKKSTAIRMLTE